MTPDQLLTAFRSGDLPTARAALDVIIASRDTALYDRFLLKCSITAKGQLRRNKASGLGGGGRRAKAVLTYVVLTLIATAPEDCTLHRSLRRSTVTVLDLTGLLPGALPPEIGRLTALKRLQLTSCGLSSLPESISGLSGLRWLELTNNPITEVPAPVQALSGLKTLWLRRNTLQKLQIGAMSGLKELMLVNEEPLQPADRLPPALEELTLIAAPLRSLPAGLGSLSALRALHLGGLSVPLPDELCTLPRLESLHLTAWKFGALTLPEDIGSLSSLTSLCVRDASMPSLPPGIGRLTRLKGLTITRCRLAALPEEIGSLTALTNLWLFDNALSALPESVSGLTALEWVRLYNNQLTTLPAGIGAWTAMRQLELQQNQLTALPESIGEMASLTRLKLGENQLIALPETIGQLVKLEGLFVNKNQLTTLPETIGQLAALTALAVDDNRLTAIPTGIGRCAELRALDLSRNSLRSLPEELSGLSNLYHLDLNGNHSLMALPPGLWELERLAGLGLGSTGIPEAQWPAVAAAQPGGRLRISRYLASITPL